MFSSYSANPLKNGSVGTAMLVGVLYVFFGLIDPFGFKSVSSEQSERMFNRFVSGPWYASEAQNKVTVIIVDDSFVESQQDQWPLSYYTQDWLIDAIASYKPKGLYLDFLYRQRHHKEESIDQYRQTLRRIANDIPVYLPSLVRSNDFDNSCDPDATEPVSVSHFDRQPPVIDQDSVINDIKTSGVKFSYIGWQGCGDLYPAVLYQSPHLMTPGFALYRAVCGQDVRFAKGCRTAWKSEQFEKPIRLIWGTGASPLHRKVTEASDFICDFVPKRSFSGLLGYQLSQLKVWITQLGSASPERGTREQCTYSDTLSAEWFNSTSPEVIETIRSLVEDRIVLVGARLDGVPDTVYSPVNGSVPGVYLFATALDNYLEYGADTAYQSQSKSRIIWEGVFVSCLFLIACGYWRGFLAKNKYIDRGDLAARDISRIIVAATVSRFVIPLVVCLIGIFCLWSFSRLPMDWILLISLSFVFTPVVLIECFDERPGFIFTRYLIRKVTGRK